MRQKNRSGKKEIWAKKITGGWPVKRTGFGVAGGRCHLILLMTYGCMLAASASCALCTSRGTGRAGYKFILPPTLVSADILLPRFPSDFLDASSWPWRHIFRKVVG